jgi:hypothetical protein
MTTHSLEILSGRHIAVLVGMGLQRKPAVRFRDLLGRGIPLRSEHSVRVFSNSGRRHVVRGASKLLVEERLGSLPAHEREYLVGAVKE